MAVVVERAAREVDDAGVGQQSLHRDQLVARAHADQAAGWVQKRAAKGERAADWFDGAGVGHRVADIAEALDRAGVGNRASEEIGGEAVQFDQAAVTEWLSDVQGAAALQHDAAGVAETGRDGPVPEIVPPTPLVNTPDVPVPSRRQRERAVVGERSAGEV